MSWPGFWEPWEGIMTTELAMLAFSVVLGFVYIVLSASYATQERGLEWNAGARDAPMPALTGVAGRLDRALRNFFETFPLFAAAILIAHVANRHSTMTVLGAHLYFWGRLAYLPLYAMGIAYIRTLAWAVATLGIVLILIALL
jgi:uncharacterized MAPEG superfamily protein